MKLTGKARIDFMKWYFLSDHCPHKITLVQFDNLPFPFQWGVYVDFFDSKGLAISDYKDEGGFHWCIGDRDSHDGNEANGWGCLEDNRETTRALAIEKANEIYNAL